MNTKVPFLDFNEIHKALKPNFMDAVSRIFDRGDFVGGEWLRKFETEYAHLTETKFALAVSNGTSALRLALQASGIGHGDEVVTVPNTFIATTEAISQVGARVRFVDVEADTCLMDPVALESTLAIQPAKAVVPVHLYGQCANMDSINAIAQSNAMVTIEDAAQAHGAKYKGRPAGSLGNVATFSFYPTKNLGAGGEGGAVTTNDKNIAELVSIQRDHGQITKSVHIVEGENARLDAIQAAFLSIKIPHLSEWNSRRRLVAKKYDLAFENLKGIDAVKVAPHNISSHHLYVVHVDDRDQFRMELAENGIGTGMHYPTPLHLQPCYRHMNHTLGDFPNAEYSATRLVSLPIFPSMSEGQVNRVIEVITRIL